MKKWYEINLVQKGVRYISLIFGLFFISQEAFPQTDGVCIGVSSSPDPSAMLEVRSTTQGFLAPRMTQTQRNNIVTPATGLIVFNTTSGRYNYYDGTAWQDFVGGMTPWVTTGNSTADAWDGTTGSYVGTSSARPLVIATTDASLQSVQFWTNNTERMRLTGDGKLGVGVINPTGVLEVIQPSTAELGDAPALNIIRDNNGGVVVPTYPVARIIQDNTADQNAALYVKQDGVPASAIELPAVYGLTTSNSGAEQAIGVWGDATGGQATIGMLATGNGVNNIALQVNDGDFAMGRSSTNPSPGTAVELATAGTEYSDNGPSGVMAFTLGSSGDLVTSAPTAGTFQDLGMVTVSNTFVKAGSIILVNVVGKTNGGSGPSPLNSLFMIDVETRANGSFTIHVGMMPNETSGSNYDSDEIRIGYMVINPSK